MLPFGTAVIFSGLILGSVVALTATSQSAQSPAPGSAQTPASAQPPAQDPVEVDDSPVSIFELAAPPRPQPVKGGDQTAAGQPVFRDSVEVINMSVTVSDTKGKTVPGLVKEDFVILEDGKQQEIVNFRTVGTGKDDIPVPIGVGLVLDYSGSMCDFGDYSKQGYCTDSEALGAVRTAVNAILTKKLKKDDEAYFIEFSTTPSLAHPWTTDKKSILEAMRRQKTKDGTAIYDAIAMALPVSAKGKHKKQIMVVITDGDDTNSTVNRAKLAELARASEVIIYALVVGSEEGVGSGRQTATSGTRLRQSTEELSQITDATGGRALFLRGFTELEKALNEFASDFTTQYEIGFQRSAEADGKYHPVRVGVRKKEVTVRHRLGYVAD